MPDRPRSTADGVHAAPNEEKYRCALGVAHYRLGKFQKEHYPQALALLAKCDPDQPTTLAFLSMTQHQLGQKAEAQATLIRLRNLLKTERWTKDEESQTFLAEAAEMQSPRVSSEDLALALAYKAKGQLDKAIPLFEKALAKRKALLGPDHPDTLVTMNYLGVAYWSAKQLDRSVPLFEELLQLRKAKLGLDHPDTLLSMANLAVNYRDAGRLQEALPLFEEAWDRARQRRASCPLNSPRIPSQPGRNLRCRRSVRQGRAAVSRFP